MSASSDSNSNGKKPGKGGQALKSGRGRKTSDLALLHSPTEDGEGARIIRCRDGELFAGEVRPVKEGQSLNDQQVVRLRRISDTSPICEVEVLHDPADANRAGSRSGPARITTDAYRRNWKQVFDKGRTRTDKPVSDFSVN